MKDYEGQVQVEHRCFALAPTQERIRQMFGSPEAGKAEILSHWQATKGYPDSEDVNVELMRSRSFPYPHSMPGLLACKAAEFQGGQKAYWDMFDRIQRAHAVEARNIADPQVLHDCAAEVGLDLERWTQDFNSIEVRRTVEHDLTEAQTQGIHAVPTLVLNDKWAIPGAAPEEMLRRVIDEVLAGRNPARR